MSWVFLTDNYVYKPKEPVRTDFLDFSTPEARRSDCEREFELSLRLARSVYLGVAPLCLSDAGRLSLGEAGGPIGWPVKMRHLPAWRTLGNLIVSGSVQEADVRRFADHMSCFYASASPVPTDASLHRQKFGKAFRTKQYLLQRPQYRLQIKEINEIASTLSAFVMEHGVDLGDRGSRVVEAHGDLRPEYVYLTATPVVIDCLEFNQNLRLLDPADELAYLAMECDRFGASFIERWVLDAYERILGDHSNEAVVWSSEKRGG